MADDERWIVVGGRRRRRSDPGIPEAFRAELVAELMDARRAVGAAGRADDAEAETAARARVQAAKVALGERGAKWWDPATEPQRSERIEAVISALLRHREGKTICPSDVARVVAGTSWRAQLDAVRSVAATLVEQGELRITQRGEDVSDPRDLHGPVRLRRP